MLRYVVASLAFLSMAGMHSVTAFTAPGLVSAPGLGGRWQRPGGCVQRSKQSLPQGRAALRPMRSTMSASPSAASTTTGQEEEMVSSGDRLDILPYPESVSPAPPAQAPPFPTALLLETSGCVYTPTTSTHRLGTEQCILSLPRCWAPWTRHRPRADAGRGVQIAGPDHDLLYMPFIQWQVRQQNH